MTYTLEMIDLGLTSFLEIDNERVKACIDSLIHNKIIQKD